MKIIASILALIVMLISVKVSAVSQIVQTDWASPSVKTVKRVSSLIGSQHQPYYLSNLDCDLVNYRLVGDSAMHSGCYSQSAFGMVDSDSDNIIFNGTDEALPIIPYSPHEILVPWPKATNFLALDPAVTEGMYVNMYRNPANSMVDNRNIIGQLNSKSITAPPELKLTDGAGRQLVVNDQTIGFSANASWMVAETLNGAFVRVNLDTLSVLAFGPSFGTQGVPGLFKSQVAVSDSGRYVAISNDAADSLKVYDLDTCGSTVAIANTIFCQSYEYKPFVKAQISGLRDIRHVRFINEGLLSFEAQTYSGDGNGIYLMAPTQGITSLTDYIGLGDSYTSGEGAFDYISGTDTGDNVCHLSAKSYPMLLRRDLFSPVGGHSVACSGALIKDVGSTSENYHGQMRNVKSYAQLQKTDPGLLSSVITNYLPGYIAQQQFVKQYQPAVVTVSIGGNDVGFGDILQNCVEPHLSLHISDSTCYNTYEDRLEITKLIDRTVPKWTSLLRQLASETPGNRIYAIGYPSIVSDKGSCPLNAHLGKSELEFADEMVDYINAGVQKSANSAGVGYVDIGHALDGHRLCEAASYSVAVNGLTAGKAGSVLGIRMFGSESYHPNALGHELIEQAILKQTNNLKGADVTLPKPPSSSFLAVPKTGRAINLRSPAKITSSTVFKKGQSQTISVKGAELGLKPKTNYLIKIDGSTGVTIGGITSDGNGDVTGSVTLPGNTTSGGHTIDLTGNNQTEEPVDITQPIIIPVLDSDADGDGVNDDSDSCPGAVNSGQDSDSDGVDDACDDLLGQSAGNNNHPASTHNSSSNVDFKTSSTVIDKSAKRFGAPNHVLGVSNSRAKQVGASKTRLPSVKRQKLRSFNWLRLVLLLVLAWLIIVILSTIVGEISDKFGRKWRFRLQ